MITLGIDTSLDDVSFAIVEDSVVRAKFCNNTGRSLVDKINGIFIDLLTDAKIEIDDIDRCGIVIGPGSFTGLRIGIAFAKGLFASSKVKVAPVSSLECIARTCAKTGDFSVILDARQGEVFFAKFNNDNGFVRLCADERIPYEEALNKCSNNITQFQDIAKNRAETAAIIAAESEILMTIDDVYPNYMQASYAERNKK